MVAGKDNKIKRTLLYEDVVNKLYELIDENNFMPGDKLPTERELTEALGISRNVLRESFHVLERRGIISSRQGQGRFLRHLPSDTDQGLPLTTLSENLERFSMIDAYEVRQVLEIKAIELIIRNSGEEDWKELDEAFSKLEKHFEATGDTSGEFDMHRLYAKKSGSFYLEQVLNIVLDSILEMMHSKMVLVLSRHDQQTELNSHKEIISAIKSRDTERAKMLIFNHLQQTMDMLK